jgi:hypothetical protein
MIMWIVASLLFAAFVAWNVLTPLLVHAGSIGEQTGPAGDTTLTDAKERGLRALKDLDLDYAMGKLTKEDYEQARTMLTAEVANVLDRLRSKES